MPSPLTLQPTHPNSRHTRPSTTSPLVQTAVCTTVQVSLRSFPDRSALTHYVGRGYPDVSAVGDGILVISNGAIVIEGGTSASAPIFASILNRINEHRLLAGKTTVGFVNPTLVSSNDVVVVRGTRCEYKLTEGALVCQP